MRFGAGVGAFRLNERVNPGIRVEPSSVYALLETEGTIRVMMTNIKSAGFSISEASQSRLAKQREVIRMPSWPFALFLFGFAISAIMFGCGSSRDSVAATPPPTLALDDVHDDDEHETGSDPSTLERGRAVFLEVGCASCHGDDASGTVIAPGLAGHNELQVRRQVRGPIGVMPVFGRDSLSPEDLDALVSYVESLEGTDGHGHTPESGLSLADRSLSHHRMALTAFEAANVAEAQHHIEHLIDILKGQHLVLMEEALQVTLTGDIHDAQHMIETMLFDVQPEKESLAKLHLRLGLSGLRVDGIEEAIHHLEHAIAEAEDSELAENKEILMFLRAGDLAEAEEHLAGMLGQTPIGIDDRDDHGDGDDH